ncbi:MAG: LPS assembly protein LptD [Alphaproteobacteria bacterium]|nr:LPS assembly protein LptD [Alphaproteobacteria bacterium]
MLQVQSCLPALAMGLGIALLVAGPVQASAIDDAPEFVAPQTGEPPPGTRVDVVADRLTYDANAKIATATGTVHITYGPYTLTATNVVYDMARNRFKANGSVVLREPNGNIVEADMADLDDKFKEGFANHVKALLTNDVTITSRYARRYENGITVFEQATYTACKTCVTEGGTPVWQIVARETTHDEATRTLYYRDAKLEIGGVPVAYTPYFSYPDPSVKRRSGFLIPGLHYGNDYGFGISTPYFWALAPNADLTIAPRFMTEQGVLGDVEWRHRLANGMYSVRGYGLYELDPDRTEDVDSRWRGAVQSDGRFDINRNWSWGWDATAVSDREFFDDYDINTDNMITSSFYVTGLDDRNYASAQALHYRTLLKEESQDQLPVALPYVTANYIFDQTVFGGELGLDIDAYSISRDQCDLNVGDPGQPIDPNDCEPPTESNPVLGTEQTRAVTELHWHRQFINGMGTLVTPFARLRSDFYVSDDVPTAASNEETTARVVPTAGLDVRMPFVADHGFAQSVLTPVAQIISTTDEQDADDRSDEDAITLNFDHTNLFLSSDLVGGLAYQPNDYLRFTYEARVVEDLSRINVQEAMVSLTLDRISGSLAYADVAKAEAYGRDDREKQVWGDAVYRLTGAWNVFGGFRYDLEEDAFMEKLIGIGFDCECMNARLTYSEDKDLDEGVDRTLKFSVELRTIGEMDGGFNF